MQSKYSVVKYTDDEVAAIRKEYNLDTEEKREEAFRIIEEWLLKQDHHVKKKYSRDYLERCLITSKGSIEKTKQQIDFICTMRTLMPQYFQITNCAESVLLETSRKCVAGYMPRLTKDLCRLFILKIKPDVVIKASEISHLQLFISVAAEFLKSFDYYRGYYFVCDMSETNTVDLLSKVNLLEIRQYLPICTLGYGIRIKGMIFVTASTFIEGFVKILKPLFKEKIRNRIHVVTDKERLKEFIFPNEIMPENYGGSAVKLEQMHEDLWNTLCSKPVQNLLKEMNVACTDESKRRRDKFHEQYMGMSGSFRTMSLD